MPAYNAEIYIEEAIESVLSQSYTDWELIVINDCSKDSTKEIVERFCLKSKNILLINNDNNLGGAGTRNRGIDLASGRYIAFLDSDDYWTPNKLETQITYMQEKSVGFVFSSYIEFESDTNIEIYVPPKVNYSGLLKCNYIGCLTVVYDTTMHGKFKFPLTKKRHDYALWLNMLKKFEFAFGVQKPLAFYRVQATSLSSKKSDAFSSYFYVLNKLQNIGFFKSLYYTLFFSVLVVFKKKFPRCYKFLVA